MVSLSIYACLCRGINRSFSLLSVNSFGGKKRYPTCMYTSYIHYRTYTSTIHLKGRWPHFNKVIKTPRIYTRFSLPLSVLRHLPSILPLWERVLPQFTWQKKRRLVIHEAARLKTKKEMKARRSRGRLSRASPFGSFVPTP